MNNKISIPNGALVVVADHNKALLLKNTGTPVSPSLEVQDVLEAPENPLTHEQGTDKPGRAALGSHRSAVEQTDWHALAGKQFLIQAAELVAKTHAKNGFDSVVLVAPPRALADLRGAIGNSLRDAIIGELDKDLTNMPVAQIAQHLAA